MSVSNLCPIRCFCGNEIQSAYASYCQTLRSGKTIQEALNTSGLPMSSPFAPPVGAPGWYVSPPSICCRALLMCNSDLSTQHNIYQSIVRWAEGDAAIGAAHSKTVHSSFAGAAPAEASVATTAKSFNNSNGSSNNNNSSSSSSNRPPMTRQVSFAPAPEIHPIPPRPSTKTLDRNGK